MKSNTCVCNTSNIYQITLSNIDNVPLNTALYVVVQFKTTTIDRGRIIQIFDTSLFFMLFLKEMDFMYLLSIMELRGNRLHIAASYDGQLLEMCTRVHNLKVRANWFFKPS